MLLDRKSKAAGRNELKEELEVIERAKKEADEDEREDAKSLLKEAASSCAEKQTGTEDAVSYYLAVQKEYDGEEKEKKADFSDGEIWKLRR